MSKREKQFANIIRETAREAGEIGFTPTLLLQATLPHSDPGDVPVYQVKNGNYTLRIRPDIKVDDDGEYVTSGIPYGGLARLLVAFITERVKSTGQRTIDLGRTQTAFMDKLDIGRTGGKHGRIRYLQDQLSRLAHAVITFEKRTRAGGERVKVEGENVPFARSWTFWHFESSSGEEGELDEGVIRLDRGFRDEIMRSSIPVDFRVLQLLRKSPLAMDLYTWLTYRQAVRWRMTDTRPLVVPWKALHDQFGASYKQTKHFAAEARKQLKLIGALWPELDYETPRGRLKVFLCPPHIGSKPGSRSANEYGHYAIHIACG